MYSFGTYFDLCSLYCKIQKNFAQQKYKLFYYFFRTPHDFPLNNCEADFNDRATLEDLNEIGKLAMGFSKFDENIANDAGAVGARKYANKILNL